MGWVYDTLFHSYITTSYSNACFYVLRKNNYLMGKIDKSMVWQRFAITLVNFTY